MGNLISRIIQKQYHQPIEIDQRSLNVEQKPTVRSDFDTITTRLGVKLASVGLVALNIFKELKRNWGKFLNVNQNNNDVQYFNSQNEIDANIYQNSQNRFKF